MRVSSARKSTHSSDSLQITLFSDDWKSFVEVDKARERKERRGAMMLACASAPAAPVGSASHSTTSKRAVVVTSDSRDTVSNRGGRVAAIPESSAARLALS